jgi:ribosomal-protein-alanine N-acetyltransferase
MAMERYKQEKEQTKGPDWSLIPYPPPAVIESKRLILRPLHIKDAPILAQNVNNQKILAVLSNRLPNPYTLKDAIWFVNHCNEPKPMPTQFVMVPKDSPNGEPIGVIDLEPGPDIFVRTAQMGYVCYSEILLVNQD